MSVRVIIKTVNAETACNDCGVAIPGDSLAFFATEYQDRPHTVVLCEKCKKKHFPNIGKFGWVK